MSQPIQNDRLGRWMTFGLCAFILFCATIYFLVQNTEHNMWPEVLYRLLTDGVIALLWLTSAIGIGAIVLRAGSISSESKALMFATSSAVGLGIISLFVLLFGLGGWMTHGVAKGLVGIGLVSAALTAKTSNLKFQIFEFRSEYWLWLIVVPIAAMVIVAALEPPGLLWGDEPHGYDVVEYHLQVPREWYELGRIVPLHHNVFSYFPFNVEMHYLLAMHLRGGPWAGMYLAQLMHVIFIAMTIVALVGIAKPQAAMVAMTVPWMAMLASVAYDEGGLLFFGTLAVGWILRGDGKLRNEVLAGAMAGLACGVKLTAVPTVLLATPLAWIVCSFPYFPPRDRIKRAIIFIVSGVATFSPWMIRNMTWTGNPVFPEAMPLLGKSHFSDTQVERWQRAHSTKLEQRDVLSRFDAALDQIILDWRYGCSMLFALAAAAALMSRSRQSIFLITLLLIQFVFWMIFTHLQGRFFILAIPIAAMLLMQVNARGWNVGLTVGALVNVCVAMVILCPRVARFSAGIGVENIQSLLPERITAALASDKPIALAGDARAFLYQIPMNRLTYRTVFDVDSTPSQSVVEAWTKAAPADATLIVDGDELKRFSKTYWNIPPLLNPSDEPFLKSRTWLMAR